MKRSLLFLLLGLGFSAIAGVANGVQPSIVEIKTNNTSMILSVNPDGELLMNHYGGRIDDATPFLSKKSYRRSDYCTDNMAYGTQGSRNEREPALSITHADGDMNTTLQYVSFTSKPLADNNIVETTVCLRDTKSALNVQLIYRAYMAQDVVTSHAVITNAEQGNIALRNYYSSALPIKAREYYLNHFYGAWAREMQLEQTRLTHGTKSIESRKQVRTTHTENPSFMLALDTPLDENCGEVIAGALAWSGNFKLNFEVDDFDVLTIMGGINPFAAQYTLAPGESFVTPDMIYTFSREGAGGATRNLHDWGRAYSIYSPTTIRPTLLNSWEGAYFDFNAKTLCDMIDDAAHMGLEMFVLDDGWFGNKFPRNDTKHGLGDWQVNVKKLPEGIASIASYAKKRGLQFGIWIEPEMVNPNSNLAVTHPDWVVRQEGREATTMRNQWLLDLCNPAVQDFVFNVFDSVMMLSPDISYIKWDANRHVEGAGSSYLPADRQSHFWVEYTRGLYKVYDRIRAKYPRVIIQACASGGGRVEYGALKYHNEVWTSDNTDALSRVYTQYGTNMIYPALVTGSHVSASPNHQTGNMTPLKFRFDIAMSGRLGMELQPKAMSPNDQAFARMAIANYKSIRDLVMFGDLYRIESPYSDKGFYSLMYVAKDKRRAVVYGYCLKYQGRSLTPKFRLRGLDPAKSYVVRELNVEKSKFWGDGKTFSGEYLIQEGINPPLSKVYDSAVFEVTQVAGR